MSEVSHKQTLPIATEDDVLLVRRRVRELAGQRKFDTFAIAAITTATSELARNVLVHGAGGRAEIEEITMGARTGLRVAFIDDGPGIPDIERVLAGGYSTARSMGLGLSGSKRLVDDFSLESTVGHGDSHHDREVEAVLTSQWLGDLDRIEVIDEASLTLVRDRVRALGAPREVVDRAVLAASELGWNQLRHARAGRIAVRALANDGVELIAADAGAGIDDIELALDAPLRTSGSLGVGIGSVKRLSTELDIDVRLGEGSCLRARFFPASFARRREVGIYGRAIAGEARSGDHAAFSRDAATLAVAVCDGLGHGPEARAAADAAIAVFAERAAEAPSSLLMEVHRRIARTRGVVMASARIALDGAVELSSAGNVEALVTAFRRSRRFGGTAASLGVRPGAVALRTETSILGDDDVFVLMTDGIVARASIESEGALLRAHPAAIAQRILERFARPHDDALVLVVR